MTKEEREDLKKKLAQYRGAIQEIAERSGVSRQMVYEVLRGTYPSDTVIEVACEVLEERKKRRDEVNERFKTIIAAL